MKYVGSKNSIAKYILLYVLSERKKDQWYVEPFVGGGNIIDKVRGNRIGADANYYLIECLKLIRDNPESLPKNKNEINENKYLNIKNKNKIVADGLYGYYGFALSYGGKWWAGYCRNKRGDDYAKQAFNSACKQSFRIKKVDFVFSDYKELVIPAQSIIYCDPPYINTTNYKTGEFNHQKFYDWTRGKVKEGHKVYISEYQAPDDFVEIWARTKNSILSNDNVNKKGIEKLFIHESQQGSKFFF